LVTPYRQLAERPGTDEAHMLDVVVSAPAPTIIADEVVAMDVETTASNETPKLRYAVGAFVLVAVITELLQRL
jgi:hypothetical protein